MSKTRKDNRNKHQNIEYGMFIAVAVAIMLAGIFLINGGITGLFISEQGLIAYTEDVNWLVDSDTIKEFEIQESPDYFDLRSVRLTGSYTGNGSFSAYLKTKDGEEYLILDEFLIKEKGISGVTGLVVSVTEEEKPEEAEPDYDIEEEVEEEEGIIEELPEEMEDEGETEDKKIEEEITEEEQELEEEQEMETPEESVEEEIEDITKVIEEEPVEEIQEDILEDIEDEKEITEKDQEIEDINITEEIEEQVNITEKIIEENLTEKSSEEINISKLDVSDINLTENDTAMMISDEEPINLTKIIIENNITEVLYEYINISDELNKTQLNLTETDLTYENVTLGLNITINATKVNLTQNITDMNLTQEINITQNITEELAKKINITEEDILEEDINITEETEEEINITEVPVLLEQYRNVDILDVNFRHDWKRSWGTIKEIALTLSNEEEQNIELGYIVLDVQGYDEPAVYKFESKEIEKGISEVVVPIHFSYSDKQKRAVRIRIKDPSTMIITSSRAVFNPEIADEVEEFKFEMICSETCLLSSGISDTSYDFIFDIDSGSLKIEDIDYVLHNTSESFNESAFETLYTKVKEDPEYDAVLDSVVHDEETDSLTVIFHHDSIKPLPIFVKGRVDYELSQNMSSAGENVTLIVKGWDNKKFRILVGSHTEAFEFGDAKDIEVTADIKDNKGNKKDAKIEFIDSLTDETIIKKTKDKDIESIEEGEYDIRIELPEYHPVQEIFIDDLEIYDDLDQLIDIDDVPEEKHGDFIEVYAIDPTGLDFTDATVTSTAKGNMLYKCEDWDFENQFCYGVWKLFISDLVPGEDYNFTLTPDDPGFAESIDYCVAEDESSKGSWDSYCDSPGGSYVQSDDGSVESHLFNKLDNYAGLKISSVNSSVENCQSITNVSLCFEWWYQGSRSPEDCDISVDSDGGESFTTITTSCPGSTPNPGLTCIDLTSLEDWDCSDFFGGDGSRAYARSELKRTTSGPYDSQTAIWDAFYFDVEYESISIEPTNASINLELVEPKEDFDFISDEFNEFTLNLSCDGNDCGNINLTLDPQQSKTYQIDANNRDAWDDGSSGSINHNHFGDSQWWDVGGYQFKLDIPYGSIIDQAYLSFYIGEDSYTGDDEDYSAKISVEETDNAPAFDGSKDDIRERDYWDSTISWNIPEDGFSEEDWQESPDISSLVQHIIDLPGWESNNHIGFEIRGISNAGGRYENIVDYYENPSFAPKFYVTWTSSTFEKGIISTTIGDIPFYTNKSNNPYPVYLEDKESQLVTFWVNATGNAGSSYDFFAYANLTSDPTINDKTEILNITIIEKEEIIENYPPTQSDPLIISANGNNDTYGNLTCYNQSTYDPEGNQVKNIIDWNLDGSSLAILNMPFESYEGDENNSAKDYSIPENKGMIISAIWLPEGGYDDKGAYYFDGDESRIVPEYIDDFNLTEGLTLAAWIKPDRFVSNGIIMAKPFDSFSQPYIIYGLGYSTDNNYDIALSHGSTQENCATDKNTVHPGEWQHVVATFNKTHSSVYIDGELSSRCNFPEFSIRANDMPLYIGYYPFGNDNYNYEGMIDDILVYDFAISSQQVRSLYENKNNMIVYPELSGGDLWKCSITPNDGYQDGQTLYSEELEILSRLYPSVPSLITCDDGSCTNSFIDDVEIECSGSIDSDNDYITYVIESNYSSSSCLNLGSCNSCSDLSSCNSCAGCNGSSEIENSVIYSFNSWNDKSWDDNDPSEMVDGSLSTSSNDNNDGHYVHLDENTCQEEDIGKINSVEIRSYWKNNWNNNNRDIAPMHRPYFEGSVSGSDYTYGPCGDSYCKTSHWGDWIDITDDANAPSIWTWDDVKELDMRIISDRPNSGKMYISKTEIRVNYSDFSCIGDLDCSQYTFQDNCEICNQCSWQESLGWKEIGNHSENASFIWNISEISEQEDIALRCRAIDLEGSKEYSDYFDPSINLVISSCIENWQVQYTSCNISDKLVKYYIDSSLCGTTDDIPSDNGTIEICDYCTPDWTETNTSCQLDDTIIGTYIDSNNCYSQTGLSSDNLVPSNNTYACDYCTPELTNTSWSDWLDTESCQSDDTLTQQRTLTQYDSNLCNEISNQTFTEQQDIVCDYCTPDWTETNTSCQPDDTIIGTYIDSNNCYVTTQLESDNNPPGDNTYACDYCTPELANTSWSGWEYITECLPDDTKQQRRKLIQYDLNNCNEIENQTFYDFGFVPCDYCTPSLTNVTISSWENITECQPDDTLQQRIEIMQYDLNNCNEIENQTFYDYQNAQCDYCTPNLIITPWSEWYDLEECQSDDLKEQRRDSVQYDANGCNEISNSTFYEFRETFCDYCTPDLINTSWTGWINTTCSENQMNQSRTRIQYDSNYCNEIENQTFISYQLIGPDFENTSWSIWSNITECLPSDYYVQQRNLTQSDIYGCAEDQIFTEQQNVVCDYCTPNLTNTSWSSWSDIRCIGDYLNQSRSLTQYDSNNCNEIEETIFSESRLSNPIYENTSWTAWYNKTNCLPEDYYIIERSLTQYDIHGCADSETFYEQNNLTCDYCTPELTNTSWSDWLDTESCQSDDTLTQQRTLTQYDSNICNEIFNQTFIDQQDIACDYCTPDWTETNTSCQLDDTIIGTYIDSNNCYSQTGLSSDNLVPSNNTYACDYCTPDWRSFNTSCRPDDTILENYVDSIFCSNITGLQSDRLRPRSRIHVCDYIISNEFSGTNFTAVDLLDLNEVLLEVKEKGKINFIDDIKINRSLDLDSNIEIRNNFIFINSSALPELNKPATIILYNLTYINPIILKDGKECNASVCQKISYENGTLIYNVSGFSEYHTVEGPYCGDNVCTGDESCSDCSADCGVCPSSGAVAGSSGGSRKTKYQCSDSIDNDKDDLIDYPDDPGCISRFDNDESEEACLEFWICSAWNECIDGTQSRICNDLHNCNTSLEKPIEIRSCNLTKEEFLPLAVEPEIIKERLVNGRITGKAIEYIPKKIPNPDYLIPAGLLMVALVAVVMINPAGLSKSAKKLISIIHITLVFSVISLVVASFLDVTITGYSLVDQDVIEASQGVIMDYGDLSMALISIILVLLFVILLKTHRKKVKFKKRRAAKHNK